MKSPSAPLVATALLALLAACAPAIRPTPSAQATQAEFWSRLQALCGQAYAGRVVADTPAATGADPFRDQPLRMHVRECSPGTVRIPFHVGDDRSRTWVLTRTPGGIRLKHDHRHADGQPDALTQYGGDTLEAGSAGRQAFPADAASKAMFTAQGRGVSNPNVWALEIEPGRVFVYELSRPGRLFRVEFDLAQPVPAPPAPWGAR